MLDIITVMYTRLRLNNLEFVAAYRAHRDKREGRTVYEYADALVCVCVCVCLCAQAK
jgi:hypothetical protein